jgi:hypothetical protein
MTSKSLSSLSEFLTLEEQSALKENVPGERPHPVGLLLLREEGQSQEAVNTNLALKRVSLVNMSWLDKKKPRITGENLADAAAALAEMRAYGALLDAGYAVEPVRVMKKPTPDFRISDGDTSAVVEVQAKQFFDETAGALLRHNKWVSEQPKLPGVSVYEHSVHPFGKPIPGKPGDTVTANAISRICGIKPREHQFSNDMSSILWLDFQDLYTWNMSMTVEQFRPVISWNEHLTSGALWYGLYGWKGAPIFEHCHYSHLDLPSQIAQMGHDGRFLQPTKLSGVVISLPAATILAESPRKERQLPREIRFRYLGLPHSAVHHSIADWAEGLVRQTLLADAALICGLQGTTVPNRYPNPVSAA